MIKCFLLFMFIKLDTFNCSGVPVTGVVNLVMPNLGRCDFKTPPGVGVIVRRATCCCPIDNVVSLAPSLPDGQMSRCVE